MGMVLVDEAHRGQGFGSRIFEHGLEYARENGGGLVGLDATHLGEPIYRNYGFERVEPVFRWQGTLPRPEDLADEQEPRHDKETIERLTSPDVDAILEFDCRHVGVDRSTLLEELFAEPEVRGFYSRTSTGIEGYAVIRPGRTHWQIGPLVAAKPSVVGPLLRAVSADLAGEAVIVDSPERGPTTTSSKHSGSLASGNSYG
ncbi:GNAT family N-acetyltransferase [Saliphagus sp. GCM10025308]